MENVTPLMARLREGLPDEISDIKKYTEMSKEAATSGDDCAAAMLMGMAWEEHAHARHIMHMLERHGISYADYAPAFHEADAMLRTK